MSNSHDAPKERPGISSNCPDCKTTEDCMLADKCAAEEHALRNAGVARELEAMAQRIRSCEPYEDVLLDYGYAEIADPVKALHDAQTVAESATVATPRTDAEVRHIYWDELEGMRSEKDPTGDWVTDDFARQLERENAELRRQLADATNCFAALVFQKGGSATLSPLEIVRQYDLEVERSFLSDDVVYVSTLRALKEDV